MHLSVRMLSDAFRFLHSARPTVGQSVPSFTSLEPHMFLILRISNSQVSTYLCGHVMHCIVTAQVLHEVYLLGICRWHLSMQFEELIALALI